MTPGRREPAGERTEEFDTGCHGVTAPNENWNPVVAQDRIAGQRSWPSASQAKLGRELSTPWYQSDSTENIP